MGLLKPKLLTNPPSEAVLDVLIERQRQVGEEGFTPEHDDQHTGGEMALAGACYARQAAMQGVYYPEALPEEWPFDSSWWKPRGRRRDLVRAAALLIAEIERLDGAAS